MALPEKALAAEHNDLRGQDLDGGGREPSPTSGALLAMCALCRVYTHTQTRRQTCLHTQIHMETDTCLHAQTRRQTRKRQRHTHMHKDTHTQTKIYTQIHIDTYRYTGTHTLRKLKIEKYAWNTIFCGHCISLFFGVCSTDVPISGNLSRCLG